MKRMLMAIMAVAVAISFSAPAFADDTKPKPKEGKDGKDKGGHVVIYGDEKKDEMKKPDKKGGETKK